MVALHVAACHFSLVACSNNIISVFFRLDRLRDDINNGWHGTPSELGALDELFVWLDAVAAATTKGPVLLVATHADKVPDVRVTPSNVPFCASSVLV